MTTWEQVKDAEDKAQQMMSQTASMGFETVMQFARVGQMLIELKEADDLRREEEGGRQNFSSQCEKFLPNMNHNTRSQRMTLARYLPLIEQHRPNDQKSALALIKNEKPKKPKAIPAPQEQDEEQPEEQDMKRFNLRNIILDEKLVNAYSGGAMEKAVKDVKAAYPEVLVEKDEMRTRAICKQLRAERNPDAAKAEAEEAKAQLPKSAQEKLDRVIQKWQAVITADFQKQFDEAVAEKMKEIEALRSEAWELKQKTKAEYDAAAEYRIGIDSHMSQDEFKLVRGCLHSDRVPDDMKERFKKAFQIFNRLEKTVNTKAPLSVLRSHGWEKVSPFHKSH